MLWSLGQYTKEHTRRWAAPIDRLDAFVFVTPEYIVPATAAVYARRILTPGNTRRSLSRSCTSLE
jgi:hypothetical protein